MGKFKEELVGCEVKVLASKNSANVGISGRIVDETRATLVVKAKGGERRVLKRPSLFEITLGARTLRVPGSSLLGTSSERLVN